MTGIHEKVTAAAAGSLPNWWAAYAADGPHADEYIAGHLLRHKSPHARLALAWAAKGPDIDPELHTEALDDVTQMTLICLQIKGIPGHKIMAPLDWAMIREDWADLLAAYRLREKVRPGPHAAALSAALAGWDGEVRRLRREGLRLSRNPPWVDARFAELAAHGHKGWWLPAVVTP